MKIPEPILPLLRKVASSQRMPLEFWHHDSGHRIMDCFFELATVLALSNPGLDGLPRGYRLAGSLFRWEAECQAEGWNAFEWVEDVHSVASAYAEVGLASEGQAILRAAEAWKKTSGQTQEAYGAANAAYNEIKHEHPVDFDRIEYLVDYFCEHANELFYEPQSA